MGLCLAVVVRRRRAPGTRAFAAMMVAIGWWCLTSALHGLATSVDTQIAVAQAQYAAIVAVPPLWLLFIAGYAGAAWVRVRAPLAALWTIPAITVVVALTAREHEALWTDVTRTDTGATIYGHGWWFWMVAAYFYVLMCAATWYLAHALRRSPPYRPQLIALIAAAAIPWAGNVLYLSQVVPLGGLDPTPLGFTIGGALMAWALFRTRVLDLVPVARHQLVDSLADPVLVIDSEHVLLDMNAAALQLAGSPERWLGERVDTLFPFLHGDTLVNAGTSFVVETGSPRSWFDVRVSRVRSRRAAWLVLLHDITDQRRVVEEREGFVRKRTEFVATVAHELRTPMFSVQGALQLVLGGGRSAIDPEDSRLLANALRSCERLARIINEILHISMIEAERDLPKQEPVAAGRIVTDALFDTHRHASEKRVTVDNSVPPDLPLILGDHDRLVQVLVNLIANAIKHSPPGATVTIDGWRRDGMVCLAVADRGTGISAESLGRIFHRFQRGDHDRASGTPGTGLGLAISRAIVEQHGGRIAVESAPGAGSTFMVYLPQAPQSAEAAPRAAAGVVQADTAAPPARLLVADDDPDVRDIVTEALERRGFTVTAAADGQQALDILDEQAFDAAVLDLQMPRCTGHEVIRTLRAAGRNQRLPIVVLTGNEGDAELVSGAGADVLLTKPTDLRRLVAEIESLLERRPAHGGEANP